MTKFIQRNNKAKIGIVFETETELFNKSTMLPINISSWDIPGFNRISLVNNQRQFIKKKQTKNTRSSSSVIPFPRIPGLTKKHVIGIRSFDF